MSNIFAQSGLPRPWEKHRVTVCLPHLDTPDLIELSTRLWQLQDEPPFILVVDTGSCGEASIEMLNRLSQDPEIEVARLAIETDVEHRSDRVSIAMDYGFTRCPTEYLLAAHTDMFPKHRGLVRKLRELCNEDTPVVGWEMSPRGPGPEGTLSGTLAKGVPGHVCTIFHMPTMDRIGAGWSIRRAHHAFGLPRGYTDVLGWPDTEICLGKILAAHGIQPLYLGTETNDETQETDDWVHARSSTTYFLSRGDFLDRQSTAHVAARARLDEWELDAAQRRAWVAAEERTHANGATLAAYPGWPSCHSLRRLPNGSSAFVCLHPMVHASGQRVSVEICKLCSFPNEPPPENFRPIPVERTGAWRPDTVAVIIRSHGDLARLDESLSSVLRQTHPAAEVLILHDEPDPDLTSFGLTPDDLCNSEVNVRWLAEPFEDEGLDIDDAYPVRTALAATNADVICVMSAGDRLDPRYLELGLACFTGASIGIVYSDVVSSRAEHSRRFAPTTIDRNLLGRKSILNTECLVLREALVLTQPLEGAALESSEGTWRLWRRILDHGWQPRKQAGLYHRYVPHKPQSLPPVVTEATGPIEMPNCYFEVANLDRELVTLFIPLSGRRHLWPAMAEFLDEQTWPHDQVRLILFDTGRNADFSELVRDWVDACDYADVRQVRRAVGVPGLADRPRIEEATRVSQAMARIYGWLSREAVTDYVWILEDDVFPPADACERLLRGFDSETASVSAAYQSRSSSAYVAWHADQRLIAWPGDNLQRVGGNGFGCVVVRGDVLRNSVFTATLDSPACDNAFYIRLQQSGLIAKIDWSLIAEHRTVGPAEVSA